MSANPYIVRFVVGKSYRLHTSPSMPQYRSGTIVVKAEIAPRDKWGNRTLLVDAFLNAKDGGRGHDSLLGVKCFVEEGYSETKDAYGIRTIPAEIAAIQGVYPDSAKAYANAEVHRGGFVPVSATRMTA